MERPLAATASHGERCTIHGGEAGPVAPIAVQILHQYANQLDPHINPQARNIEPDIYSKYGLCQNFKLTSFSSIESDCVYRGRARKKCLMTLEG